MSTPWHDDPDSIRRYIEAEDAEIEGDRMEDLRETEDRIEELERKIAEVRHLCETRNLFKGNFANRQLVQQFIIAIFNGRHPPQEAMNNILSLFDILGDNNNAYNSLAELLYGILEEIDKILKE